MKGYPSNQKFVESEMLSYEKVVELLNDSVEMGGKAIQFTGGGEPLTHPRCYDMVKQTFDRKLDVAFVTNGMALDEKMCDLLGDACWVRVSVDAATHRTYSSIRNIPSGAFYQVLRNIELLRKYRREVIIGIGFVVNQENYKEIYEATKIFRDLGVDNLRISAAFTNQKYAYFESFRREAQELAAKAELLRNERFEVFNLFTDRVRDTFLAVQDYDYCPMKELNTFVGADYNVYTCCTLAYNKLGLIGSFKETSFKELWESTAKKNFFATHNPRKVCSVPCLYRNKNEFINYCLKHNPRHVNFP